MSRKIHHAVHGLLWEREFARPPAHLQEELQRARALGHLVDLRSERGRLVVQRAWVVDGTDLREFFGNLSPADRQGNSLNLFQQIHDWLRPGDQEALVHGALHPGNLQLRIGEGVRILDPVANRVLLGPPIEDSEPDEARRWLWRPFVPATCSLQHWDLLNLLRLATLLGQGPEVWNDPPGTEDVLGLCRQWCEDLLGDPDALREGEDLCEVLEKGLALLPQVSAWPEVDPGRVRPRPLEIVRELLEGRLVGRVLTRVSEHRMTEDARSLGLSDVDVEACLDYLLARRGALRERALEDLVGEYLDSGVYPGMRLKIVRRNAWGNALRFLETYGFDAAESRRKLQEILADRGIKDESQAEDQWLPEIRSHFASRVRKGKYCPQDIEEILKSLRLKELHERLARRWIEKYIVDERLSER